MQKQPRRNQTSKAKPDKSTVTKGAGDSGKVSLKDALKDRRVILVIFIILGVGLTLGIAIPLSIGNLNVNVTPSDHVSVQITNAGDLMNMTEKFSATVYTVDPNIVPNNSTFHFYRQWKIGVNGSTANLSLVIGVDGNAFVIRLVTTEVGYGNFSDISIWVGANGIYTVQVFKDPGSFGATVLDAGLSSNITGDSDFSVFMKVNAVDAGFQTIWQPQIYSGAMSFFNVNFTFDTMVTFDQLNLTTANTSPYGNANYFKWTTLSNGNKSITFLFYVIAGGPGFDYNYSFKTAPMANITSIKFQFGDITMSSRVLKEILV